MQRQCGATYVNRNEAFPALICLDAIKFVLLSFFSLINTICLGIGAQPQPKNGKNPPLTFVAQNVFASVLLILFNIFINDLFYYSKFAFCPESCRWLSFWYIQWMEVGRTGADGLLAPNHVGLGPKNVLEPVRAHLRATAGKRVWDQRGRNKCVTGNPALVRTIVVLPVLRCHLSFQDALI